MIQQNIKIGEHTYNCELYKSDELEFKVYKEYCLLRNIDIYDMIAIDSDIYVVDKDIIDNNKLDTIVYPVSNSAEQFSTKLSDFMNTINFSAYNLYSIENDTVQIKKIKCDKIRIYHPLTKVDNSDLLIYIGNNINGTKFHYFCDRYDNQPINSSKDIHIYNDIYSEYIEFYIPAVEDIISKNTYFIENTNSCIITAVEPEINKGVTIYTDITSRYSYLKKTIEDVDYLATYIFNVPYSIFGDTKRYLPEITQSIETMYLTQPINLCLYPFSDIDDQGLYIPHNELIANLDVFVTAPSLSLKASLEFTTNSVPMIKSRFVYPNPEKFSSLTKAYEYYNSVSLEDEYQAESSYFYYEDETEYEESGDILLENEIANGLYRQYPFTYQLLLSTDTEFKNIIYTSPKLTNENTLSDRILNKGFFVPLFDAWEYLPELLLAKVVFTDRYLGTSLESNFVVISKEYYKYLVNYDDGKIYQLDMTSMSEKMNFYNKIVCTVKKTATNPVGINNIGSNKIIYKPVFYKVQDLQNIKIQHGVTQNIGINLSSYMTKVDSFVLTIDGNRFIETGRNDMYVIFSVQANLIYNKSGVYHIANQDNEYISSGSWSVVQ